MYNLSDYFEKLNSYAPLALSQKMIEKGCYDNSGVLVNLNSKISGVLFTLDLSEIAVKRARRLGVNTIVTHHPAIYQPIASLSAFDKSTCALALAVSLKMNVISMHLNLDVCEKGIDACLCEGLGGKQYKIIDYVDEHNGYGREFKMGGRLNDFVKNAKKVFGSKKIIVYGNKNKEIKKVASFCGAGASDAVNYAKNGGDADVIVTSDVAHHLLKELIDRDLSVVILPHYVAEEYGFNKFYEWAKNTVGELPTYYFADQRFK